MLLISCLHATEIEGIMSRRQRNIADLLANEKGIVSSALIQGDVLDRLDIAGTHFIDSELGKLWDLLKEWRASGKPFDVALLMPEITNHGIAMTAGDLHDLFKHEPNSAHAVYYRDNVVEGSKLRDLDALGDEISAMAKDAMCSSEEILEFVSKRVDELQPVGGADEAALVGDALVQLIEEVAEDNPRQRSAMVGLWSVDEYLGGMAPGEMHVIGARPSRGKTALGLQIAMHNAEAGRNVLFAALEMTVSEMAKRIVCSATDVNGTNMRDGTLSSSERKQIIELQRTLSTCPLSLWTPHTATLDAIRRRARQAKYATGLDLLVVDYLGLIKAPSNSRKQRWEIFTEISNGLKRLAREIEVPILVLQQLGRDSDGRSPRLSDLRDSGSVEQDADGVILIDYGEKTKETTDDVVLNLAKNRHGQTGKFKMVFDKPRTCFRESSDWTA